MSSLPYLLPALLLSGPAAAQDAPVACPGLHVAASPAANMVDLRGEHIRVPAGADGKAERVLYAWSDGEAACDAAIYVAPIGAPGATVAIQAADGLPLAQLSVVPGAAPRPFTITAQGLATVGTWSSPVTLWAQGQAADLVTLDFVVTQAPVAPTLSFLEAGASGLTWRTISAPVDHALTLVETGKKVSATVTIPPVRLTSGDMETTLTPDPATVDLPAGEALTLRLTGVLPAVGSWTGRVLLEREGGHDTVPITVERVSATALPALEALAPPILVRGLGESVLPVRVQVSEAGSRPVHVSSLTLSRLLPPGSATTSTASVSAPVCWARTEPAAGQLVDRTCPDNGVAHEAVAIPPGGSATWWMTMAVPWEAGSYTGTVQARTLEGDAVPAASFTFHVKHPAYLCLLAVVGGVVLSAGLRGWVGQGRAAAVAAIPLARLSDRVRALPAGDRIRTLLELEVARLREVTEGQAAGIAAAEGALDNYLAVSRLREILPLLPQIVRDAGRRAALAAGIQALLGRAVDLAVLRSTPEGGNPLVAEAGRLYEEVRAAAAATVTSDLAALEASVTAAQGRLAGVKDPQVRADLLQRLTAVTEPLTRAGASDGVGPSALLDRLAEARAAWSLVAADLDRALPPDNEQMGGEGGATYQQLLDGLGLPVALPQLRFGRPPAETEQGLRRWIRSMDALVLVVVILLAGTFALYELWWRADAWGTFGDYLAALVWGFGAHLLGGAAQTATAATVGTTGSLGSAS